MAPHTESENIKELIHEALDPGAQFLKSSVSIYKMVQVMRYIVVGILVYSIAAGVYLVWRIAPIAADAHRISLASEQRTIASEIVSTTLRIRYTNPSAATEAVLHQRLQTLNETLATVQLALRNGSDELSVPKVNDDRVRDALLAVDGAYSRFHGAVLWLVNHDSWAAAEQDEIDALISANTDYHNGMDDVVVALEKLSSDKIAQLRLGSILLVSWFVALVILTWLLIIRPRRILLTKKFHELETYRMAIEYTGEHIVFADQDGKIIYANRAAELITGYSRYEMIGKRAGGPELWGGLMDKEFYEKMWKTIKNERKVFKGKITNRRKNGQQYTAAVIISPVLDSAGEIQFFIGVERDLSQE